MKTSDYGKDSDEWIPGRPETLGEMRGKCPDPRLTAHERNDPIELAAIESGMNSWDAWQVYDGNYYDIDTYLDIAPETEHGGFEISWTGNMPDCTREQAVAALRRFAEALLRVTSTAPTGSSSKTTNVTVQP